MAALARLCGGGGHRSCDGDHPDQSGDDPQTRPPQPNATKNHETPRTQNSQVRPARHDVARRTQQERLGGCGYGAVKS